jgi:CRP/FNR family cyclic AMP-dependent transcriptional regulator
MITEELLGKVNLFASCSKGELHRIAKLGTERRVAAGTVLMREGDPADAFFVIAEGLASVTSNGRELGSAGPGTTIGETALLDGGERTATVTAVLPTRLLAFEGNVLDQLVDGFPVVAKRLLMQTSKRLRSADALAAIETATA